MGVLSTCTRSRVQTSIHSAPWTWTLHRGAYSQSRCHPRQLLGTTRGRVSCRGLSRLKQPSLTRATSSPVTAVTPRLCLHILPQLLAKGRENWLHKTILLKAHFFYQLEPSLSLQSCKEWCCLTLHWCIITVGFYSSGQISLQYPTQGIPSPPSTPCLNIIKQVWPHHLLAIQLWTSHLSLPQSLMGES